jgi:hypothetical protein
MNETIRTSRSLNRAVVAVAERNIEVCSPTTTICSLGFSPLRQLIYAAGSHTIPDVPVLDRSFLLVETQHRVDGAELPGNTPS